MFCLLVEWIIYFCFLISCLVGVSLGAINGLLVSYFKIPTLIATLGTLNIFHGLLLTVVGTKAINSAQLPDCLKPLVQQMYLL